MKTLETPTTMKRITYVWGASNEQTFLEHAWEINAACFVSAAAQEHATMVFGDLHTDLDFEN